MLIEAETGAQPDPAVPPSASSATPRRAWAQRAYAFLTRHLLVLPIFLVGGWLRFNGLNQTSLWLDEILQVAIERRSLAALLPGVQSFAAATPLDYLIGAALQRIHPSDFTVRLPAALFGVGALLLLYWLGCLVFNRWVALGSTALLVLAPLHLFYSREARGYALLTFMALAVTLAFCYLWQQPSVRRTLVYGGVAAVALYGHYYSGIVLVVQGLVVAPLGLYALGRFRDPALHRTRRAAPAVVLGIAAAFLAFLPWILYDLAWGPSTQFGGSGGLSMAALPLAVNDANIIITAFGQWTVDPNLTRNLLLGGWLLGAVGAAATRKVPAVLVAVLPPLGSAIALALIFRNSYFFATRQFIFCLPFYLLGATYGLAVLVRGLQRLIAALGQRVPRRRLALPAILGRPALRQLALLLPLLGGLGLGARNAQRTNPGDWQRHDQEEGWRQAADLINTYRQPGDTILVPAGCSNLGLGFNFNCIDLYHPELAAMIRVSPSLDDLKTQYATVKGKAWILLARVYNQNYFQGNDQLHPWISDQGLRLNNFNLVEVAYPDSRLMIRPPVPLAAAEFQPLMGNAAAEEDDVLRLTRPSPDQPVSMTSHPLTILPQRQYLVTFEYQALLPSTGPFQVAVNAPDSTIPGRFFAYNSPDVPSAWRSASLIYISSADSATAAASRLIVRYDGSGSVAVRNLQIYDTTPTATPVRPATALLSDEFQPLLGSAVAEGKVLRLTRAGPDQPVSLTAHPLDIQPRKSYLILFEYRAAGPSTPPFSVYVDAPDSMIPGRHFAYSSPDMPTAWQSASFTYLPNADAAIAAASRLIVRYDGSGSVEVRNIRIATNP